MDTFLVLGASSRLASTLKNLLPAKTIFLDRNQCDITSRRSLEKIFKQYTFQFIINCVAITDINYCETHPQKCFDVNTIAVVKLSTFCQQYKKKLIHISSDYAVNPMNAYGISKYLSENLVTTETLIIRTNFYDEKTYIVKNLLAAKPINVYQNVYFNPISITRLVEEIFANKNKQGVLNIFSSKRISYFSFAKKLCREFNLSTSLIKKTIFKNTIPPFRPLSSFVKPDINVDIVSDIKRFKEALKK